MRNFPHNKLIPDNLMTKGFKPEEDGVVGQRKEQFSEGTFKTLQSPQPPYTKPNVKGSTIYSGPIEDLSKNK